MPDPAKLLTTLEKAAQAMVGTPGRRGRFVELQNVDDILVAGDLHGNLRNFKRILDYADLPNHSRRHLVIQELVHGPFMYPNEGGDQSHRAFDLMSALKCQFPTRVHMLVGNHEMSQFTNRAIMKDGEDQNDLFIRGVNTAYGTHGAKIYGAYERIFNALPAALRTPNRVFLSHSLPAAKHLPNWELDGLFRDQFEKDDYKPGGSLHSIVWGRDTSEENADHYMKKVDADLLISGHIPCDDGFDVPNSRQLILDCCGEMGRVCLFSAVEAVDLETLRGAMRELWPLNLG